MGEHPAEPFAASAAVALAGPVAGDAVADAIDAAELLDVDMDELAGLLPLIAGDGRSRIERREAPELIDPLILRSGVGSEY
jgi:hypothetical protein